jgi:toxin YoeB
MIYEIDLSDQAKEGMLKLKKSGDKQILKKLSDLIEELKVHPETGTGKPEHLKYEQTNRWSRRITDKHRLVYDILENIVTVEIIQVYRHYGDK